MKRPALCLALVGASVAADARAGCYAVYLRDSLIFQSQASPVDLSRPLSETVPQRFGPGTLMVTSIDGTGCREVSGVAAPANGSAALLDGAGARRSAPGQADPGPAAKGDREVTERAEPIGGSTGAAPVPRGRR